jgi:hypothetical protein
MCKYRININDKINSMDTLKKQNHSLYLELQKIREKELQDEQDLWRNEVWFFLFFCKVNSRFPIRTRTC